MKKILLATTMLTATAGIASAEMSVTGTARMGVVGDIVNQYDADGNLSSSGIEAAFSSRFRVVFTGSGTTDGGLTFGATARADNSPIGVSFDSQSQLVAGGGATGNRWQTAGTVYLAGSFGTLTMGDTGNAADDLVGQVAYVGYTSLNSWNEIGNLDRNLTGVEYSYSMNGFTFSLGSGQTFSPAAMASGLLLDDGTTGVDNYGQGNFWAVGAKYATDVFSVALGYQTNNDGDIVSASGSYTAAGFTGIVKIADDSRFSETMWALSAQYAMDGGIGLTAYYNHDQDGSPLGIDANNPDTTAGAAYGFGASYDLGGGASVVGGIAQRDNDGYGSIFDLGVQMSF